VWTAHPELNVTPAFLGDEGIRLALDGQAVDYLPQLAGMVTSPAIYMPITLSLNLVKTQQLANLYKQRMENDARIQDGTVRPDVAPGALGNYSIINCSIQSVRELNLAGRDAGFMVSVRGYYIVNNSLWDAA
jgi:hypothetical protein